MTDVNTSTVPPAGEPQPRTLLGRLLAPIAEVRPGEETSALLNLVLARKAKEADAAQL